MVEDGHLDSILPSPSQIRYLDTKWPSKIEARWGNFDFTEIRYSLPASSGHALKSKLAASVLVDASKGIRSQGVAFVMTSPNTLTGAAT